MTAGSSPTQESPRGPYRQELLYALRRSQDTDTAAWNTAPALNRPNPAPNRIRAESWPVPLRPEAAPAASLPQSAAIVPIQGPPGHSPAIPIRMALPACGAEPTSSDRLPELIGNAPCMLEVGRRVRRVAPRMTPVLIEGPTGSGKELVAEALHRMSPRSRKPFCRHQLRGDS